MKKNAIEPYGAEQDNPHLEHTEAYQKAKQRVKKIIGFYWHLAAYVIVNLFLLGLFSIQNLNFWSFGTFSTAFFWGIGLAFHFLGVFGSFGFFGKEWKARKIRAFMDKDRRNHLSALTTSDSNLDRDLYELASKRVERLKGFYIHLSVYVVVNLLIVVSNINDLEPGESYFKWQNFITLGFWGIGILAHSASVFIPNLLFNSNWEARKMQEFMDKEVEQQRWE
ncbi:2TM domain-containing protein [Subsaximicrobium wynnwilliamsii]|nr:2TM domain-containing protein [Subsaximicrobium wynnwilliamsii]